MLEFYQHLPEQINPIALSIDYFSVRWYSIMYLTAFAAIYALLKWRATHDIDYLKFTNKSLISNGLIYSVLGLLIGARLGYVLLYNLNYYLQNPLNIISPYDFSNHIWTGIFGMSYFGGALGVAIASYIFTKRKKINFLAWTEFVLPAIPAGYFFGRIGNFLNGELYGRITEKPWGMYFPADFNPMLRHPSQLYEAFFEGLVLFLILWLGKNKIKFPGQTLTIYLFFYGLFRFGIEFFRQPDVGSGLFLGGLTLGQILSLSFIFLALVLWSALSKREKIL